MKPSKLRRSKKRLLARALLLSGCLMVLIVTAPTNSYAFDTAVIDWAMRELCGHITGAFGSLLTAVAVLGAIVSAALGSFRVFFGAIIVGIGAYTVPNIVSLYFSGAGDACQSSGGGRARSAEVLVAGSSSVTPAKVSSIDSGLSPELPAVREIGRLAEPATAPAKAGAPEQAEATQAAPSSDEEDVPAAWGKFDSEN